MGILFLSLRLYIYGYFCDISVNLCTYLAERAIIKNRPLNKKLLTKVSNFSDTNLTKWQIMERRYISLCIRKGFSQLL